MAVQGAATVSAKAGLHTLCESRAAAVRRCRGPGRFKLVSTTDSQRRAQGVIHRVARRHCILARRAPNAGLADSVGVGPAWHGLDGACEAVRARAAHGIAGRRARRRLKLACRALAAEVANRVVCGCAGRQHGVCWRADGARAAHAVRSERGRNNLVLNSWCADGGICAYAVRGRRGACALERKSRACRPDANANAVRGCCGGTSLKLHRSAGCVWCAGSVRGVGERRRLVEWNQLWGRVCSRRVHWNALSAKGSGAGLPEARKSNARRIAAALEVVVAVLTLGAHAVVLRTCPVAAVAMRGACAAADAVLLHNSNAGCLTCRACCAHARAGGRGRRNLILV